MPSIIHIPRQFMGHPPIDLYRATPESIAHAKAEAARERAEVERQLDEVGKARIAAKQALVEMVDAYSWATVNHWLGSIRAMDRRHQ